MTNHRRAEFVDLKTFKRKLDDLQHRACKNLQALVVYEMCLQIARDYWHMRALLRSMPKDKEGRPLLIPIPREIQNIPIEPAFCFKCKRTVAAVRFMLHYKKCLGPKPMLDLSPADEKPRKRKKKISKMR